MWIHSLNPFLVRFLESINWVTYLVLRHYDVRINYSQADTLNEFIFCGFIHWRKKCSLFTGKKRGNIRRKQHWGAFVRPLLQWKTLSITQLVCVFLALGIQNAISMHIVLSVACPALQYFSTLSHKWHDIRKNYWTQNMCLDFLYNFFFSETSFILRTEWDIIKNVYWYSDTNRLPKQALQYNPNGRRNIGRPRKRWRDQLHLEDQGTG